MQPDAHETSTGAEASRWAPAPAAHVHHSELWSELARREAALVTAVAADKDFAPPRQRLVDFLRGELASHLRTEDVVLYSTARGVGEQTLTQSLELDHKSLLSLVEHIAHAQTGLDAALSARALSVLFVLRMEKEESVLLPALRAAGVDVDGLLADKPDLTGKPDPHA